MNNRFDMLDFGATGTIGPVSHRDAAALRCGRYTSEARAHRDLLRNEWPSRFALLDRLNWTIIRQEDLK
jgi:hypothetical protein